MLKWSLILNILFLALTISSCVTPKDAPKLPRKPKQFIYMEQPDKWCRSEGGIIECTSDLKKYGLYSFDDISMIQLYIVELNEKCEKWSSLNGL